jgi:hypothetical protein
MDQIEKKEKKITSTPWRRASLQINPGNWKVWKFEFKKEKIEEMIRSTLTENIMKTEVV